MKTLVLVCMLLGALGSMEAKSSLLHCEACREVVSHAQKLLGNPDIWNLPIQIAVDYCVKFVGYTAPVCLGAIQENVLVVTGSLVKHYLDPDFACSSLTLCDSPVYVKENFTEWQNNVLASKPSGPARVPTGNGSFKFGHLADLHIDVFYQEGTNSNCGLPLCCREWNGPGTSGSWGDYNCDIPVKTLELAISEMSQQDLDFVIITGDLPPHDVWNQSETYNLQYQKIVADLFTQYFPTTPVYYMFGNHGSFPVNALDPLNSAWLLDPLTEYWGGWLDAQAIASFKSKWAYSMVHPGTNLKVIAINTQACNNGNFYLFENITDPMGQIVWLESELAQAEQNGQVVYLFGHIPMASGNCMDAWAAHVDTLIDRYSNIISGQFYGHTHNDEWSISRGVKTQEPLSIQWVAPSVTTYQGLNPSYRVYEVDSDTSIVTDIFQYRLDLAAANANPDVTPTFDLVYNYLAYYGYPDLSPQTLYNWGQSVANNETLAVQWWNNFYTGRGPATCDAGCRAGTVCRLTWGTAAEQNTCTGSKNSLGTDMMNALFGPWTYKVSSKI